jgi:hypothetical protein
VQSIHYNLASPYIFSTEAAKERNQLLKELEHSKATHHPLHEEDQTEDQSSMSLSSKSGGKALSFALGAAIVMRAHHVKAKLAEENEEIALAEMAMKSKQQQKENQRYDFGSLRISSIDFSSSLSSVIPPTEWACQRRLDTLQSPEEVQF